MKYEIIEIDHRTQNQESYTIYFYHKHIPIVYKVLVDGDRCALHYKDELQLNKVYKSTQAPLPKYIQDNLKGTINIGEIVNKLDPVYVFKVRDYTTNIVGQYDSDNDFYYVKRGDGTVYKYDSDRILWSFKLDVNNEPKSIDFKEGDTVAYNWLDADGNDNWKIGKIVNTEHGLMYFNDDWTDRSGYIPLSAGVKLLRN